MFSSIFCRLACSSASAGRPAPAACSSFWRLSSTPALDALALGLDDLLQLLVDVVHHAAQVIALEHLLAALAQALHQVAQAHHALLSRGLVALLHQAAQGAAQVAVGQQVFGDAPP